MVRTHGRQAPLLLGLAFSALTLALHLAPVWVTMLNRGAQDWLGHPLPHDYLAHCVAEHRGGADPAFARRPLTTWSIDALALLGVPVNGAFIAVGLTGFLLTGLLIHRIALRLGASPAEALLSQALFHASPTVLFAWFNPLYTYDEPLQYLALSLGILWLLRQRWAAAALALTAALIARETSALLLPALLLLAPQRQRAALLAAPLLLYAVFLLLHGDPGLDAWPGDLLRRADCLALNLGPARLGETVAYLVLVLALPTYLLVRLRGQAPEPHRRLVTGFLVALALNTTVVLSAALAREARLFALPLLLGWPLLGGALRAELRQAGGWRGLTALMRNYRTAAVLAALLLLVSFAVFSLFEPSTGIEEDSLFHEWLIAELGLIAALVLARRRMRTTAA
ncbi:MAG: hypothetical protein QY325_16210 [Flavobacteriales bacterium]|nr:MAG: hypothetical protein QY325_16210 [Flavobacteriales bacterium]